MMFLHWIIFTGIKIVVLIIVICFDGYKSYSKLIIQILVVLLSQINNGLLFLSDGYMVNKLRLLRLQERCQTGHMYNSHSPHLAKKTMIIFEPLQILLNAIPKTGRTTWKFLLWLHRNHSSHEKAQNALQQNSNISVQLDVYRKIPKENMEDFKEVQLSDDLGTISEQYFSILTVRHPFVRLESAYVDKFQNPRENRDFYYTRFGATILRRYRNLTLTRRELMSARRSSVTFEEFIKFVIDFPNYDEHWATYTRLASPCSIRYRCVCYVHFN